MIRYDKPEVIEIGRYCISEYYPSYMDVAPVRVEIQIEEPQEDLELLEGITSSMTANSSVRLLRSRLLERILGIIELFKAVDIISYTPDNLEDIKIYVHAYNRFFARSLKIQTHFPNAIIAPTTSTEREIIRGFVERYNLLNFSEYNFVNLIYRFELDNNDVLKYIIDNVNNPEVQKHYQNILYERNKKASEVYYG